MVRMNLDLVRLGRDIGWESKGWNIEANYDWDHNRIIVRLYAWGPADEKAVPTQALCKQFIDAVKTHGRVNPKTGKPMLNGASRYADFFMEEGFSDTHEPTTLRLEIDRIIEIEVSLSAEGRRCEGQLLSDSVRFIGW
jgi:hypothetical protein